MKYRNTFFVFIMTLCLLSFNTEENKEKRLGFEKETEMRMPPSAQEIIDAAIKAHGGSLYDEASYSFVFRKKTYTFENGIYKYTVKYNKNGNEIYDVLENGVFSRKVNGKSATLSTKAYNGYMEALNSVVYFATLPYKLNDKAVQKKYMGTAIINESKYNVVEITFEKEGGGKDFQDNFYYWINETTNMVDYLAYSYATSGGGVRFRSAYNTRKVDGISFQDYINWKAPIGTPLEQLPSLYEAGKLKELSRILTEDVLLMK